MRSSRAPALATLVVSALVATVPSGAIAKGSRCRGTENSFEVVARAFDRNAYTVQRIASGNIVQTAQECGRRRAW